MYRKPLSPIILNYNYYFFEALIYMGNWDMI